MALNMWRASRSPEHSQPTAKAGQQKHSYGCASVSLATEEDLTLSKQRFKKCYYVESFEVHKYARSQGFCISPKNCVKLPLCLKTVSGLLTLAKLNSYQGEPFCLKTFRDIEGNHFCLQFIAALPGLLLWLHINLSVSSEQIITQINKYQFKTARKS